MSRLIRRWITWYLVMAMVVIGITPPVYAGFSPSAVIGLTSAERSADLQKVRKFLEMKMVGERLRELGLAPGEVQSRLGQLNDPQLHQLALRVDDLTVAGDEGLGIIICSFGYRHHYSYYHPAYGAQGGGEIRASRGIPGLFYGNSSGKQRMAANLGAQKGSE